MIWQRLKKLWALSEEEPSDIDKQADNTYKRLLPDSYYPTSKKAVFIPRVKISPVDLIVNEPQA